MIRIVNSCRSILYILLHTHLTEVHSCIRKWSCALCVYIVLKWALKCLFLMVCWTDCVCAWQKELIDWGWVILCGRNDKIFIVIMRRLLATVFDDWLIGKTGFWYILRMGNFAEQKLYIAIETVWTLFIYPTLNHLSKLTENFKTE